MKFQVEHFDDVTVVTVNVKRATLVDAPEFKKVMNNEIEEGKKNIIVDLFTCEFVDSTFLGSLVVFLKKLSPAGGDLKLIGFQPAVHSMFELTRMYRIFEAFSDKVEAINSFKN